MSGTRLWSQDAAAAAIVTPVTTTTTTTPRRMESTPARELRARLKEICYTEPSLKKKMRRPDPDDSPGSITEPITSITRNTHNRTKGTEHAATSTSTSISSSSTGDSRAVSLRTAAVGAAVHAAGILPPPPPPPPRWTEPAKEMDHGRRVESAVRDDDEGVGDAARGGLAAEAAAAPRDAGADASSGRSSPSTSETSLVPVAPAFIQLTQPTALSAFVNVDRRRRHHVQQDNSPVPIPPHAPGPSAIPPDMFLPQKNESLLLSRPVEDSEVEEENAVQDTDERVIPPSSSREGDGGEMNKEEDEEDDKDEDAKPSPFGNHPSLSHYRREPTNRVLSYALVELSPPLQTSEFAAAPAPAPEPAPSDASFVLVAPDWSVPDTEADVYADVDDDAAGSDGSGSSSEYEDAEAVEEVIVEEEEEDDDDEDERGEDEELGESRDTVSYATIDGLGMSETSERRREAVSSSVTAGGSERRRRSLSIPVCYKEPSLRAKMRRPD